MQTQGQGSAPGAANETSAVKEEGVGEVDAAPFGGRCLDSYLRRRVRRRLIASISAVVWAIVVVDSYPRLGVRRTDPPTFADSVSETFDAMKVSLQTQLKSNSPTFGIHSGGRY